MSPGWDTIETYPKPSLIVALEASEMLTNLRSSFLVTAPTRALAGLIVAVSVEIAARRDTSSQTVESRAALDVLMRLYDALDYSWNRVNTYCSPEEYAFAWDTHLTAEPLVIRFLMTRRSVTFRKSILSDLNPVLVTVSSGNATKISATENVMAVLAR